MKRSKPEDIKKISSIVSLSFLIFFMLAIPAHSSSDWVEYSKDEDGNVYSYKLTQSHENEFIQVWDQKAFSKEGRRKHLEEMTRNGFSTEGYEKLSTLRVLVEFDCKKKRSKGISVSMFDSNKKAIYSMYYEKPEWIFAQGDSLWGILIKEVCKE